MRPSAALLQAQVLSRGLAHLMTPFLSTSYFWKMPSTSSLGSQSCTTGGPNQAPARLIPARCPQVLLHLAS